MVMSELTGGVDMMRLLVFLLSETYGRCIDPDQQGDTIAEHTPTNCLFSVGGNNVFSRPKICQKLPMYAVISYCTIQ